MELVPVSTDEIRKERCDDLNPCSSNVSIQLLSDTSKDKAYQIRKPFRYQNELCRQMLRGIFEQLTNDYDMPMCDQVQRQCPVDLTDLLDQLQQMHRSDSPHNSIMAICLQLVIDISSLNVSSHSECAPATDTFDQILQIFSLEQTAHGLPWVKVNADDETDRNGTIQPAVSWRAYHVEWKQSLLQTPSYNPWKCVNLQSVNPEQGFLHHFPVGKQQNQQASRKGIHISQKNQNSFGLYGT